MQRILMTLAAMMVLCGSAAATVNINIATKEDLTSIKGIGEKKAQDIIDYRIKHGPFNTVDDLAKVPGVTQDFLNRVRSQLTTSGATLIEKLATKGHKSPKSAAKTSPGINDGLKSNQASKTVGDRLTTGAKGVEKKPR